MELMLSHKGFIAPRYLRHVRFTVRGLKIVQNVICFWERDKKLGIYQHLNHERFDQSSYLAASLSDLGFGPHRELLTQSQELTQAPPVDQAIHVLQRNDTLASFISEENRKEEGTG
jgi:hypothetical protein